MFPGRVITESLLVNGAIPSTACWLPLTGAKRKGENIVGVIARLFDLAYIVGSSAEFVGSEYRFWV